MLALRTNPMLSNPFGNQTQAMNSIPGYLQKELKLELHQLQQASMIEALKEPQDWLDKRADKLEKITNDLAPNYYLSIEKYSKYYPMDEAIAMANQDIQPLYQIALRNLEIEQPGASSLMTGALLDNNIDKTKGLMYVKGADGANKAAYKQYYKEKRARKKAKKAKAASTP